MSTWIGLGLEGPGLDTLRERVHGGFDLEKLHMTLVFISREDLGGVEQLTLDTIVERWCKKWEGTEPQTQWRGEAPKQLLKGELFCCGQFGLNHAAIVKTTSGIYNARLKLVESLYAAGISVDQTYAFNPHITFGLLPTDLMHLDAYHKLCIGQSHRWGQEIRFPSVFVQCGDKRTVFPTHGPDRLE